MGRACICFVFVLLLGCGPTGPKLPSMADVAGSVNLDGQPMGGGAVRFEIDGQPAKVLEVQAGKFSGKVFQGKNRISVTMDKEGPPHPMDPTKKMMVNAVDAKFSGPQTPFTQEIGASGASDLKFDVTSAR